MISVIALSIALIATLVIGHIERRELYRRIQSKDNKDYMLSTKPPKQPKSRHDEVLRRWRERGDND